MDNLSISATDLARIIARAREIQQHGTLNLTDREYAAALLASTEWLNAADCEAVEEAFSNLKKGKGT